MLCQLLRSNDYDIEGLALACLKDYAHRFSRSQITAKVEILKTIKEENNGNTLILSSIC